MDRSKVVVHMYVSIDGKIDGRYGSNPSGQYYSDELFVMSNADANGRKTISMYAAPGEVDLSDYSAEGIEYEDWIPEIESETWSVAFDRKGRCGWDRDYFEYNGHRMHAIEVLTKQAPREYLAFLKTMNIPYLICGEREFDFSDALVKLKKYFGIETLAVCGGAVINGAFLRAHMVDEISLVVSPYVNGDSKEKSSFDTFGEFVDDRFAIRDVKRLEDGGLHLIFEKA